MTRDEVVGRLRPHEPELRSSGLAALYLFGSTARGEAREDSDVDLLFELGDAPDFSLLTQASLQIRLSDVLGANVDLVGLDGLRDRMRKRIGPELVRIF